jgi:hypothetical protein
MLGKAAMIAVLLAPMANIARHDDHKIGLNRIRWDARSACTTWPSLLWISLCPRCCLGVIACG